MSQNTAKVELTQEKSVIPAHFLDRGLDHFSPSQATTPLDVWVYKYLHCDAKKRSLFKQNAKMRCGTLVGDSVAADISGNVRPLVHYDGYKDWSDLQDEKQWENDKKNINATIDNVFEGLKEVGLKLEDKRTKFVFEYPVSLEDSRLEIPIYGKTDIQTPNLLVEVKTTWTTARKVGKTDEWSEDKGWTFYYKKLLDEPSEIHLQQASFYYHATKIPTVIIQANALEYKKFFVTDYDYKRAYNDLVVSCMKKQEVAKLKNAFKFIEPNFNHYYAWKIGDKFFKEAKELYGY